MGGFRDQGVETGRFRGWRWVGLGIRGWRRVGLGTCKVGRVGSRSKLAPWILCSAVRTISFSEQRQRGVLGCQSQQDGCNTMSLK